GAGVVEPEFHPGLTHSGAELFEQVTAGAAAGSVEGCGGTVPEAEAVVVLGGGHDVAGPCALRQSDDLADAALGGLPVVGEVLVGVSEAEGLLVAGLGGAAVDADGVGVPLGVLVAGVGVGRGDVAAVQDVGPGRYRVQAPVHEDPEFRVAVP